MANSTRRRPSSHPRMKLYTLLDTLARQGWGALAGARYRGVQRILRALCSLLPYGSARGRVTVEQIATAAQYSERWTRTCLTVLEDMALIHWDRGGVRYGRPVPSTIAVDKRMLCELIAGARGERDAQILERKIRTAERLSRICTIRFVMRRPTPIPEPSVPTEQAVRALAAGGPDRRRITVVGKGGRPLSHAAVTAHPSPVGREDRRESSRLNDIPPGLSGAALARATLATLGVRIQ